MPAELEMEVEEGAGSPRHEDPFRNEPEHPLLPLPDAEGVARILATGGQAKLRELIEWRRERIRLANADPLFHELEPPHWGDARSLLNARGNPSAGLIRTLIILGGNRSAKSRLCGKLVVEAVERHRGVTLLCAAEDETASRETQQSIIWHYLPARIKALRGRRDRAGVFYVNWSEANGFSERKLVFPNRSKILFATYGEQPEDYEGMMFGHPTEWTIQWWGDENLRLNWLRMLRRRGQYQPGCGLWSYTPIHGMTPCIKDSVGAAQTLESRPAALLSERVNVPGLPRGHMPYVQAPAIPEARVIYFFSELSPFGPGPNGSGERFFEGVRRDCEGKPEEYVQRVAYGYTRDVIGRRFPKYGAAHRIPVSQLPWNRTNYVFMDPHGDRNWAIAWVGVVPGHPARMYFYRDWPDLPTYGEWAVPTERATTRDSVKGWDGDPGPAQSSQGWGVMRYKQLLLRLETIEMTLNPDGTWNQADPYRRHRLNRAMKEAGLEPSSEFRVPGSELLECRWTADAVTAFREKHPEPVREEIRLRLADPRAAANPTASSEGGKNLVGLFAQEDRNAKTGELEAPRMLLAAAYSGRGIDDGCNHVNELLDFNEREPLCPLLNEPRLYVADCCEQVNWALQNYTGMGGESGACKEWADLARYVAQSQEVRFVEPGGKMQVGGFTQGPV